MREDLRPQPVRHAVVPGGLQAAAAATGARASTGLPGGRQAAAAGQGAVPGGSEAVRAPQKQLRMKKIYEID